MKFCIEFKNSVEKDLKKIDRVFIHRIFSKIKQLENYPQITGITKVSTAHDFYRVRVGDYRIVF